MVTIEAKAGKWLALALLVSLGANMFMGGLLAGRFAGRPTEPGSGPGAGGQTPEQPLVALVRRMAASLPDDERARFEQAFVDRRRDIVWANVAVREARLVLRGAIVADPFDRARVEQAFAELRARNEEQQRVLHSIATDAVARMPRESRQSLADWAQPRLPARPGERQRVPGGPGANRP